MKKFYLSLLTCLLLYSASIFAQQKVTGTVKDDTGETLIGVSIQEKGKPRATQTDVNGKYTFSMSDPEAVLIFSYVGYLKQEVAVGNRKTIDIILKKDDATLGELVVIGYGTQK